MRKIGERPEELFHRLQNPILTPERWPKDWPYRISGVYNPGAVEFNGGIILLVRVEDTRCYSHLALARSEDGKTNWEIDSEPALIPREEENEERFGLEDPRVIWCEELERYLITCVSFCKDETDNPPTVSIISTDDFDSFKRVCRPVLSSDKDAALFPERIDGSFVLVHRPSRQHCRDIRVSFSEDLEEWGHSRVLLSVRPGSWDGHRIGLGPPPLKTKEGWLILYHGVRQTSSGGIYRVGLALLDLETLEVKARSPDWVFGPKVLYERIGNTFNVVFPCGAIIREGTNELLLYYGAADTVIGLAIGDLNQILSYLETCSF